MDNFQWLGSPVDCYNHTLKNGWFDFYKSFSYNGEKYHIGEFALVKYQGSTKIGRLICAYHSYEKWHSNSKYRGVVQWYTLASQLNSNIKVNHIKFDRENEIMEDDQSDDVHILLKDVQKKCQVIFTTINDPIYLIEANTLSTDFYSCRYKIEYNEIVPIFFDNKNYDYYKETEDLQYTNKIIARTLSEITPNKISSKYKRRLSIDNLESEELKLTEVKADKVRSPSNYLKNVKLTRKLSNSAVKRALIDSFDSESSANGTPILCYKMVTPEHVNSENIKIKLKLLQNKIDKNVTVVPTNLNDDILIIKSPVKVNNLENIHNCINLSPKSKHLRSPIKTDVKVVPTKLNDDILSTKSPIKLDNSEEIRYCVSLSSKRKRLRSPIKTHVKRSLNDSFNLEFTTPKTSTLPYANIITSDDESSTNKINLKVEVFPTKLDNEILSMKLPIKLGNLTKIKDVVVLSPNVKVLKTPSPIKINTRRCSSRTVEKKSYVKYFSPDKSITNKQNAAINKNSSNRINKQTDGDVYKNIDKSSFNEDKSNGEVHNTTPLSVSRIKRHSRLPNRYLDDYHVSSATNYQKTVTVHKDESTSRLSQLHEKGTSNRLQKKKINDSSSSDNDFKTPKKKSSAYKSKHNVADKEHLKTPSKLKNTPSARAKMIREGIITPSMQSRKKNVIKDNTPLSKARSQLHVSYIPKSLPCREKEFADIFNFLEFKLNDKCGGCMYISGVPGTGKTATVAEVIGSLQEAARNGEVPSFTYINVNGMKISEPRQSYVEIVKQLMGRSVSWEEAQKILEKLFTSKKMCMPIILVIDELDILCTKRQDVVYNLLDWPTKINAQLIVVAIANTMDLPERLLIGRVTSRLGLTRLAFQAYTHKQLQEIVTTRLLGINAFNSDAIQLVARKVASVSGDARRALDICRRAAEIAELQGKNTLVSMAHVNEALNAMITQPKIQAIKHCSRLEKLMLQAVVAEVERTGVEETNFTNVYLTLIILAALDNFKMVTRTVALGAIARLCTCRLLLTDDKCSDITQSIILNVSSDDVYYALTKLI